MATNTNRRSFTCPDEYWEKIVKYADLHFEGNVSMAIRFVLKKVIKP